MPYPSSETSKQHPKNTAEEHSAPTAINWGTGEKTATFTNVPIATYTDPITRNICASSNHLALTADPKHPLNKNHPLHHPSPFEFHIKGDSKQRNQHHPLPPPPHHRLPTEESKRTKEKAKRKTIILANRGRSKERSTKLLTR